jgi:uncharacterized protein YecT (DUF1311 family)
VRLIEAKSWLAGTLLAGTLLAGVVVSLGASVGSATTVPTTTTSTLPVVTYNRSCEVTARTQTALNRCSGDELSQVQRQLVAAIKTEKKRIPARLVNASQKAFVTYEKAECAAEAAINRGGTIYPLIVNDCAIQLTVQRIQHVDTDSRYASM